MPKIHVEKSILINAPLDTVNSAISDFSKWPVWSPWLIIEPTAKVDITGDPGLPGHGYSWSGELVGSGSMEIESIDANRQTMDLQFLKPFKSQAKVELQTDRKGEGTEVIWRMDSSLPFFLFFMTGTMETMIGLDYDRGLKMLKAYCENGKVDSDIEIVGVVDAPASQYVGFDSSTNIRQIGDSMATTLPKVHEEAISLGLSPTPSALGALYNKMNMKSGDCDYTAFVPVTDALDSINPTAGFRKGVVGHCKAIKIVHRGAYQFLPNAWSAGMSYQRYKKLGPLKDQPPFELYPDDVATTPVENLTTEVYIPVKG